MNVSVEQAAELYRRLKEIEQSNPNTAPAEMAEMLSEHGNQAIEGFLRGAVKGITSGSGLPFTKPFGMLVMGWLFKRLGEVWRNKDGSEREFEL